mmetsp:Transcript_34628/g.99498  ORF Transcript_34628/g.99498 Transcript_34628/m.99498 type:complete len:307 (+) Transcript_34628:1083-2003(+)
MKSSWARECLCFFRAASTTALALARRDEKLTWTCMKLVALGSVFLNSSKASSLLRVCTALARAASSVERACLRWACSSSRLPQSVPISARYFSSSASASCVSSRSLLATCRSLASSPPRCSFSSIMCERAFTSLVLAATSPSYAWTAEASSLVASSKLFSMFSFMVFIIPKISMLGWPSSPLADKKDSSSCRSPSETSAFPEAHLRRLAAAGVWRKLPPRPEESAAAPLPSALMLAELSADSCLNSWFSFSRMDLASARASLAAARSALWSSTSFASCSLRLLISLMLDSRAGTLVRAFSTLVSSD